MLLSLYVSINIKNKQKATIVLKILRLTLKSEYVILIRKKDINSVFDLAVERPLTC